MTIREVQSVVLKKQYFTKKEADAWIKKHDYKGNVDETTTSYRYRQKSPSQYDDFITLSYAHGVRIIIGIKGKAKTNKNLSLKTVSASLNPDFFLRNILNF